MICSQLPSDFLNTSIWAVVRSIIRHVKDEKSGSSHEASHVNEPFFHDGGYEINKAIGFLKKLANTLIY